MKFVFNKIEIVQIASGDKIEKIDQVKKFYGGSESKWHKMKGNIDKNDNEKRVHWYEYRGGNGTFYTWVKIKPRGYND